MEKIYGKIHLEPLSGHLLGLHVTTIYVNFKIVLKKTLIHLIEAEVDFHPQIKMCIKVFSFFFAKMITRCDHFCTFTGNMPLHDTQLRQVASR